MSAASALQPGAGAVEASPISPPVVAPSPAPPASASAAPAAAAAAAVNPPKERWAVGDVLVARYPFEGTSPEDLPFMRRDVLTIVRLTKDPNWYRARNANGAEGMIPANYVRLKDDPAFANSSSSSSGNNSLPRGAKTGGENGVAAPAGGAGGVAAASFKTAASVVNGAASPMSSSNPSVTDSLNSTSSDGGGASNNHVDAAASSSTSNSNLPLTSTQQQQPSVVSPTSNNPLPNNVIQSTAVSTKANNDNNNSAPAVGGGVPSSSPPSAMSRSNSDSAGEKREVKMESMAWFHGKISRDKAEELLIGDGTHPDGTYLIRESTYFPGDYTLCLLFENKVEHYHILCKESRLTIDEEVFFENLSQLVRHYENDADGLVTHLQNFVSKCGALDFDVKVSEFYDAGWVIPKDEVTLTSKLGKGEFGDVWEGHYKTGTVAIKCLKDDARAQKILKEASIMTALRHPNLVSLQGVVLSPKEGIVWLVTEFMAKGSLVDFLRSRGRPLISKKNQIGFACDTAAAMKYLEERHIVHRDLAARNVLLSESGASTSPEGQLVAKVCDFGLARPDDYSIEGGKFPIKWTAPEALRYSKFSNKSDMWSFGVLLWEIYSFGRTPYPRIPIVDVVKHVERGYRMEAPEGCPDGIYGAMTDAWDMEPNNRPSFGVVLKTLREIEATTTS